TAFAPYRRCAGEIVHNTNVEYCHKNYDILLELHSSTVTDYSIKIESVVSTSSSGSSTSEPSKVQPAGHIRPAMAFPISNKNTEERSVRYLLQFIQCVKLFFRT
ncbi:hypothetical protein L9F63_014373, partial [Diploptera punctata]